MKKLSRCLFLFLMFFLAGNTIPMSAQKSPKSDDTTFMLTYDHGGLILWGSEHFRERLRNAIALLDKYPSFKIGLDNEAQIYDYFAENMAGEGLSQVTVFNPLSWKQTRWIFADLALHEGEAKNFVAKCGDKKIYLKPWEIKTIRIPIK